MGASCCTGANQGPEVVSTAPETFKAIETNKAPEDNIAKEPV